MTHDQMIAALAAVLDDAQAQFGSVNPGRVDQLASAIDTASMAVDYLFTEVPYNG